MLFQRVKSSFGDFGDVEKSLSFLSWSMSSAQSATIAYKYNIF